MNNLKQISIFQNPDIKQWNKINSKASFNFETGYLSARQNYSPASKHPNIDSISQYNECNIMDFFFFDIWWCHPFSLFQVYLAVAIFFVTASIISLACSTITEWKASPTKEEVRDYVKRNGFPGDLERFDEYFEYLLDYYDDDDDDDDGHNTNGTYNDNRNSTNSTEKNKDKDSKSKTKPQKPEVIERLNLNGLRRKGIFLEVTDYIILTFFTLELCARLVTCPSIFQYYKSPLNTLDTLVLILAFIEIAVMQISLEEKFKSKGLKVLLYFQILRIFRVFRIVKNVTAIKVLVFSFRTSYKDFMVLLLYVCIALTLFGSAFYFVEDSRHIQNIPEAVWLTLITMTTVGYGDLYPKSLPGRILGGICALTGVLLLALIIPVFVGTFVNVYQFACCGSVKRSSGNASRSTVYPTDVTEEKEFTKM